MIIQGERVLHGVSRERVFEALADPAILARTVPGCRQLTARSDRLYDMTVDAGVGAVRGTYTGHVEIGEHEPPERYRAKLDAAGAPGSVSADLTAELRGEDSATAVAYRMDVKLTGAISGVGQRVLAGTARRDAEAFLEALEQELTAPTAPAAPERAEAAPPGEVAAAPEERARVYPGRPRPPRPPDELRWFIGGIAVGGGLVVLGGLIGGARRR